LHAPQGPPTGTRLAQVFRPEWQFRPGLYCFKGDPMHWSKPAFEDMRFGFEITMYISHR
jgi:coenzyme PQQ precursor peptide PqqA